MKNKNKNRKRRLQAAQRKAAGRGKSKLNQKQKAGMANFLSNTAASVVGAGVISIAVTSGGSFGTIAAPMIIIGLVLQLISLRL